MAETLTTKNRLGAPVFRHIRGNLRDYMPPQLGMDSSAGNASWATRAASMIATARLAA